MYKADSGIVQLFGREGGHVYLKQVYRGRYRRWRRPRAQPDQKQGYFTVSIQAQQSVDWCVSKAECQMHWQGACIGGSQKVGEYRAGVPKTVAISTGAIFPGVAPEGVTAHEDHRGFLQSWIMAAGFNDDAPIVPLT